MRWPILFTILAVAACSEPRHEIVVPLESQPGPGRILTGIGERGPASDPIRGQWDISDEVVTGVPDTLTDLHVRFIDFQWHHLLLEAYVEGRIDSAAYDRYRDRTANVTLPDEPFDSHIHYAIGRDDDGAFVLVFDTDNDEDLSDERGERFPWEGPRADRAEFFSQATSELEFLRLMASLPHVAVEAHLTDGETVYDSKVLLTVAPHLRATRHISEDETVQVASIMIGAHGNKVGTTEIDGTSYSFWAASDHLAVFNRRHTQIWFEAGGKTDVASDSGHSLATNPYLLGQVIDIGGEYYRLDDIAVDGSALTLVPVDNMPGVGIRPGMEAPEFRSVTIDGTALKLSDYRGKYVLLDFWSTNCGPCIKDLPVALELYREFGRDDFEIIGIAQDEPDWLRQFANDNGITWPQVVQGRGVDGGRDIVDKYRVTGIPAYFLVDREGKIAASGPAASPTVLVDSLRLAIAG